MASTSFDTLAAARALEAAGVERKQAEAHADVLRQAATADRDDLATRTDLGELRDALRSELATIRWAIGLLAALVFAIGLGVFGVI